MDREQLKDIMFISTRDLPIINREDGKFEYFLGLLGRGWLDKWNMLLEYNKEHSDVLEDYIQNRDKVKQQLREAEKGLNIENRIASQSFTYPFFFTCKTKKELNGKKVVRVDLREAGYNVCRYFGIYKEKSLSEHLLKYTNNDFLLNHDNMFHFDILPNLKVSPVYPVGYKEMMWDARQHGLDEYMSNHGCVCKAYAGDCLYYEVLDDELAKTIFNEYAEKDTIYFNGIGVHFEYGTFKYLIFKIPRTVKDKTIDVLYRAECFIDETGDEVNPVFDKETITLKYTPQFYKIVTGKEIIDDDFYYLGNDNKANKVTLL